MNYLFELPEKKGEGMLNYDHNQKDVMKPLPRQLYRVCNYWMFSFVGKKSYLYNKKSGRLMFWENIKIVINSCYTKDIVERKVIP